MCDAVDTAIRLDVTVRPGSATADVSLLVQGPGGQWEFEDAWTCACVGKKVLADERVVMLAVGRALRRARRLAVEKDLRSSTA